MPSEIQVHMDLPPSHARKIAWPGGTRESHSCARRHSTSILCRSIHRSPLILPGTCLPACPGSHHSGSHSTRDPLVVTYLITQYLAR